MACADAVGYQPREGFEFVPSIGLESAIVRRGALPDAGGWRSAFDAESTGQSDWERLGGRFLSVGPEVVA